VPKVVDSQVQPPYNWQKRKKWAVMVSYQGLKWGAPDKGFLLIFSFSPPKEMWKGLKKEAPN